MSGFGNIETMNRANKRRYEIAEASQVTRLEQALAAEDDGPPPVDRGYCFVCGGECPPDMVGHATCTGRRAA